MTPRTQAINRVSQGCIDIVIRASGCLHTASRDVSDPTFVRRFRLKNYASGTHGLPLTETLIETIIVGITAASPLGAAL